MIYDPASPNHDLFVDLKLLLLSFARGQATLMAFRNAVAVAWSIDLVRLGSNKFFRHASRRMCYTTCVELPRGVYHTLLKRTKYYFVIFAPIIIRISYICQVLTIN